MNVDDLRAADEAAIVRELVERYGLREFVKQFWPVIQPGTPFIDGWHIGAICEFVEAFLRRQITNGIISVAPGSGKTKLVSVCAPVYCWTWHPEHRFLLGSYNDSFLTRDGRQSVSLISSELYQRAWPGVTLTQSAPAAKYIENTSGGLRYATTPGAGGTGEHGHSRMFDDPMKAADKHSEAVKEVVRQWWNGTMSSRIASGYPFGSLGIMQRLTKDDLAEDCLNEGYEHLCLPAEYVPSASWDRGCSLGKLDPRSLPGELMAPDLCSKVELDTKKAALKNRADAEAQYQQNPVPDTGGIIERPWIKRWKSGELPHPSRLRWCTSWDLAFDGTQDSQSRVAGGLFCAMRFEGQPRFWFVAGWARHINYPDAKREIRKHCGGYEDEKARKRFPPMPLWSNARKHLIEKKANGAAMLAELRNEIRGLKAVCPADSKADRLIVHSDKFEQGEVWFPEELVCPQVTELEDELVFFPNGDYDDFVDIVTQALDELDMPNAGFWENMRKLAELRQ